MHNHFGLAYPIDRGARDALRPPFPANLSSLKWLLNAAADLFSDGRFLDGTINNLILRTLSSFSLFPV